MAISKLKKTLSTYILNTASCIYNGNSKYHPIIITNAMKNIIGDVRSNPSKQILDFLNHHTQNFKQRRNDSIYLENISKEEIGLTVFISDLEDACQNGDLDNTQKHLARIYLASDGSPAIMQNLAEIALQNIEGNIIFIYHCLRAFSFSPEEERVWIFLQCIIQILFNKKLPNPHASTTIKETDINKYFLNCSHLNELNTLSATWRLLESEYTRLPGFEREISFWLNQCNKKDKIVIKEKNPDDLQLYLNNQTDYFVTVAEDIIQSDSDIIDKLITLESLRYFTKRIDINYLPVIAYKIHLLLDK
ncbi:MAG: hypothetical protein CL703_05000 [Chloroflexi bacterium]|nr:hypothetical protein [Chloroflexota bacterium]